MDLINKMHLRSYSGWQNWGVEEMEDRMNNDWNIPTKLITVTYKNKTIESKTEIAWFVSELCLSLGMIGTVIGFIQMLAGFSSLNIGNVSSMQSLVVNMGYGMATALYTTLAGLIFGNILKIEAFDIERSFKNMVEQNGNK